MLDLTPTYSGPAFEDRFAVNLPRAAVLAEGPSPLLEPVRRFNQLLSPAYTVTPRIYARDIYIRDIKSLYSYNLWGFEMAPDRMFQNLRSYSPGTPTAASSFSMVVVGSDP